MSAVTDADEALGNSQEPDDPAPVPRQPAGEGGRDVGRWMRGIGRWIVALGGALLIYSAFLLASRCESHRCAHCDVGLVVR